MKIARQPQSKSEEFGRLQSLVRSFQGSQEDDAIAGTTSDQEHPKPGEESADATSEVETEKNNTIQSHSARKAALIPPHEFGNAEPESGDTPGPRSLHEKRDFKSDSIVQDPVPGGNQDDTLQIAPEVATAFNDTHQRADLGLEMGTQTMSLSNDKRHDTSALDDISEHTSGGTPKSDPAGLEAKALDSSDEASGNPSGQISPEGIHIYHHDKGSEGRTVVDIVAVHGLGGHVERTWKHSGDDVWLRDPKPGGPEWGKNARIMAFGYTTEGSRIFNIAENLLSDLLDYRTQEQEKRRCIIFIGHCLGGIIIKAALAHAHNNRSQFEDIIESTQAIVFFATPHHGSSRENWIQYMKTLSTAVKIAPQIIEELCTWSHELVTRTAGFSNIASRLHITSFYATGGVQVVCEGSARLGLLDERVASLNASHRDICRFQLTNDDNYRRVSRRLETIIRAVEAKSLKNSPEYEQRKEDCMKSLDLHKSRKLAHNHATLATTTWTWIHSQWSFKQWRLEDKGMFLLSGELGYTKSILTEHIASQLLNGDRQAIIIDAWAPDQQQNKATIIQSLLHSALTQRKSLIDDLKIVERYQELGKRSNERVEWPCGVLQELLESLLFYECREPTYVIIDARHDAAEQYILDIVDLLRKATSQANQFKFKVFVTFRHDNLRSFFPSKNKHVSLDYIEDFGRTIFRWVLFANDLYY
ncbi:hypothetical protein BDW71DRAFT_212358 [Aspergillus fruticulosus]